MAWIEKKQRKDGGSSARVVWRLGATREGAYQSETFGAGSDAQNVARAQGFKKMVDAAGQRWPDGWVKGEGFVRPRWEADPLKPPQPHRPRPAAWAPRRADRSVAASHRTDPRWSVTAAASPRATGRLDDTEKLWAEQPGRPVTRKSQDVVSAGVAAHR
ncbi:MAG: hypothetical protein ACR2JU_05340 [Nocardioidaceae bacterium]